MRTHLWLTAGLSLFLAACNVAPKGELTRTEIDRPYTLPDDVAKIQGSAIFTNTRLENPDDSINGTAEAASYTRPGVLFENAINDDFTWVFPLGFRWRIYSDDRNSFGISAFTLLLLNAFSMDYWYRINSDFSIRPYFRAYAMDFIIVEERKNWLGAEFLWQIQDHFSLGLYGHGGKYSVRSELVEIIVKGFSNDDDYEAKVSGDFWGAGLSSIYSIDERWDLIGRAEVERYDVGFGLLQTNLQIGANYYW